MSTPKYPSQSTVTWHSSVNTCDIPLFGMWKCANLSFKSSESVSTEMICLSLLQHLAQNGEKNLCLPGCIGSKCSMSNGGFMTSLEEKQALPYDESMVCPTLDSPFQAMPRCGTNYHAAEWQLH